MYKLIVIDDEPFSLSVVTKFVRTHFRNLFKISSFDDPHTALQVFEEDPADIVMTDIVMPSMDGLELIAQMRKISRTFIPIVFSGYRNFDYAKKAISLDVIYYLEKPISYEELKACFEAAVYKLQNNVLVHNSVSHQKEDIQLFFLELMQHSLSPKIIINSLHQLQLPPALTESNGCVLRIYASNKTSSFPYEQEMFSNVCENLLRLFIAPDYLYTFNRTEEYYDLVIIGKDVSDEDIIMLQRQADELLHLHLHFNVLFTFHSLMELSSMNYIADLTADSIPASDANVLQGTMQDAISYMKQHYSEDLTREAVARKVFMSADYFGRLFKEETGLSFLDYLTEIRMHKAIELLNTHMKIKDISKAVGYNSQNRFNINFKNYTTYSPMEYRRNVLKLYSST